MPLSTQVEDRPTLHSTSTPCIEARKITKLMGRRKIEVIRGIDLSLYPGELAVLMGPSGSGKSTLLNILGLLDQSTEGDLFIHGRRIEGMKLCREPLSGE